MSIVSYFLLLVVTTSYVYFLVESVKKLVLFTKDWGYRYRAWRYADYNQNHKLQAKQGLIRDLKYLIQIWFFTFCFASVPFLIWGIVL